MSEDYSNNKPNSGQIPSYLLDLLSRQAIQIETLENKLKGFSEKMGEMKKEQTDILQFYRTDIKTRNIQENQKQNQQYLKESSNYDKQIVRQLLQNLEDRMKQKEEEIHETLLKNVETQIKNTQDNIESGLLFRLSQEIDRKLENLTSQLKNQNFDYLAQEVKQTKEQIVCFKQQFASQIAENTAINQQENQKVLNQIQFLDIKMKNLQEQLANYDVYPSSLEYSKNRQNLIKNQTISQNINPKFSGKIKNNTRSFYLNNNRQMSPLDKLQIIKNKTDRYIFNSNMINKQKRKSSEAIYSNQQQCDFPNQKDPNEILYDMQLGTEGMTNSIKHEDEQPNVSKTKFKNIRVKKSIEQDLENKHNKIKKVSLDLEQSNDLNSTPTVNQENLPKSQIGKNFYKHLIECNNDQQDVKIKNKQNENSSQIDVKKQYYRTDRPQNLNHDGLYQMDNTLNFSKDCLLESEKQKNFDDIFVININNLKNAISDREIIVPYNQQTPIGKIQGNSNLNNNIRHQRSITEHEALIYGNCINKNNNSKKYNFVKRELSTNFKHNNNKNQDIYKGSITPNHLNRIQYQKQQFI